MTVRIVVLDDGETWAGDGAIYTISEKAYDDLCNEVVKVKNIPDDDIISIEPLDNRDDS